MSLDAVRCDSCGGAVAFPAGAKRPSCVFCGSTVLIAEKMPEGIELPEGFLPFVLDKDDAKAAFKTFASSSIWYPGDLRNARLQINAVLVPAWRWSADLETCWAAIVPGSGRSGKRPLTGKDHQRLSGVLIPSSKALTRKELDAISPFEGGRLEPLGDDLTFETGSLTRTAAQRAGQDGLEAVRQVQILEATGASALRTSVVFHDLTGGPLLLPVWIGAYRRNDRLYRVVINGQTGKLTGEAPISWWRVLFAFSLAVFIITLALLFIGAIAAGMRYA